MRDRRVRTDRRFVDFIDPPDMSETASPRKDTDVGDPESEWDAVVRRISERLKKKQGAANASGAQSNLDIAGEMVRLERRAIEAETTLAQERDAYSLRVKEMEDKLRNLEPWLRQLKGEYQKAAAERDELREELNRAASKAGSTTAAMVLESEREAALREAEAARAERDAAVAEAEMLRTRSESDRASPSASWQKHIAAAEKARDQAIEEAKQLRKAVGDARRSETEIKRLLTQIDQLETTTAAHKAVARAAQEEASGLKSRIAELEKSRQTSAESVQLENRRVAELGKDIDLLRDEVATVRAAEEAARREAQEKARALESAKGELEQARQAVETLRAEAADAQRQAEESRSSSSQGRIEAAQSKRDAEAAAESARNAAASLEAAHAAERKAREALASAHKDAAESKELADEAMRAEGEARRRAEELAEKLAAIELSMHAESQRVREMEARAMELAEHLATERSARQEAERRANDFDVRAEQAEPRVLELEGQLEIIGGRVRAAEAENAGLVRGLEEERAAAAKRMEAAEASWRSQMRAAEARFEAEVQRERNRTFESDEALKAARERHARVGAAREEEMGRLRVEVGQFAEAKMNELVDGLSRIVAEPIVAPPITVGMDCPATAPTSMAVSGPTSTGARPEAGPPADWDRLIEDVEHLRGEVATLRTDGRSREDETAEAGVDVAAVYAAAAAAGAADDRTIEVERAPSTAAAGEDAGKRKKRKK